MCVRFVCMCGRVGAEQVWRSGGVKVELVWKFRQVGASRPAACFLPTCPPKAFLHLCSLRHPLHNTLFTPNTQPTHVKVRGAVAARRRRRPRSHCQVVPQVGGARQRLRLGGLIGRVPAYV